MLQAGSSYRIGRDPQCDVVINDPRVSWQHAVLRADGGYWVLEDSGSTNGTFVGQQRVQRVPITGNCQLRLGHPTDGPEVIASLAAAPVASPAGVGYAPAQQAPAQPGPVQAPPQYQQPYQQMPVQQPPQQTPLQPVRVAPVQPAAPAAGYQQPPYQPPQGPPARPAPPGAGGAFRAGGQSRIFDRQPSAVFDLPSAVKAQTKPTIRIGRATDNDLVVADLSVSRYHSELRKTDRGYMIVDLSSHNGTFLNGQRITQAPITENDIVSVGPASFRLVGDSLQEFIDAGDISFIANDLTVQLSSGKVLLDRMSFPLGERCLLGVIGPSGAGKSTLLGALTGLQPATQGSVLYDDRDLYQNYSELRHRIGLVPQKDILHSQLTARRALSYAAELRFPRDTSKAERMHRIDEVLADLQLTRHADTKVSALSGGQAKRVNVALELLTKPSLLFLDEPTSGLDPGLDKSVMEQMAGLAHDGRTVIVVTHSVDNLNLCDRLLVLVPGGKIGYFGPPQEGLKHFGKERWADVFIAFENEPGRDWAQEYRNSVYWQRYVAAEMNGAGQVQHRPRAATAPAPKSPNRMAELSTLMRRYFAVISADRGFLIALVALPVLLGALTRFFPAKMGLVGFHDNAGAQTLLLLLAVGACFSGAANSVREIVKERAIYDRERAAGLSAGTYLMSKLVILGILTGLQAVILLAVGLIGKKLPPTGSLLTHAPLVELLIAVVAMGIGSMALGLLISALVDTAEKTMPLLVASVMFQVVLSGGIFPLTGAVGIVASIAPSRWGFAMSASTTNLNQVLPASGGGVALPERRLVLTGPSTGQRVTVPAKLAARASQARMSAAAPAAAKPDPRYVHNAKTWLEDLLGSILLTLIICGITWFRLNKLGPAKRG
jgi:ABC-type multidrug transport system ATPase subunit